MFGEKSGFNQNTYDKVERFKRNFDQYVMTNTKELVKIKKCKSQSKLDNYTERLKMSNELISLLEDKFEMSSKCSKGCAHCCYQIIYVNEIECDILSDTLKNISDDMKQLLVARAKDNLNQIKHKKFPIEFSTFENLDTENNNKEYLKLRIPCPFLDSSNNSCMIYATRPLTCFTYRNYGNVDDCKDQIAYHAINYPYFEELAIKPYIRSVGISNISKLAHNIIIQKAILDILN